MLRTLCTLSWLDFFWNRPHYSLSAIRAKYLSSDFNQNDNISCSVENRIVELKGCAITTLSGLNDNKGRDRTWSEVDLLTDRSPAV